MNFSRSLLAWLALLLLAANSPQVDVDTSTKLPESATPENYRKIELGMTRQQVFAILGRRPVAHVTDADRSSLWTSLRSILIRERGDLWRSEKHRLWVVFDEENRVIGKMLEGPPEPIERMFRVK